MGNSKLINYKKISPNKSVPRKDKIDRITIHHTAGICTVDGLGELFYNKDRQASSNYGIGNDGLIGMYVEEKDRSWCSSSPANDNKAITIEVSDDTNKSPWHSSVKAMSSLILLCADICKRNGIQELKYTGDETGNMTLHKWYNPQTSCPEAYLEDNMSKIASEVNKVLKTGQKTYVWEEYTKPIEEVEKVNIEMDIIKKGYKDGVNGVTNVKCMQALLTRHGYPLSIDGSAGGQTITALKNFQSAKKLTIDGVCGKNTWIALMK